MLALDRPGYGRSDFLPDRRLLDWPDDVLAVAGHLGLERFAVLGVSGGGPYALACASLLGDRLTATGVACGLGPYGVGPAMAAMYWPMRWGMRLTHWCPALGVAGYRRFASRILSHNPDNFFEFYARRAPAADREILARADCRQVLRDSMLEAFRQDTRGAGQDLQVYTRDWGFRLEDVAMPVHWWHGEKDPTVPVAFAHYAKARLPRCHLELTPDDGHFSLPINRATNIIAALAGLDQPRP